MVYHSACLKLRTTSGSELSPANVGFRHRTQVIRVARHMPLSTGTSCMALSLLLTGNEAFYCGLTAGQQAHGI